MPVSRQDVFDLRSEAGSAGDTETVELCDAALSGDKSAFDECEELILHARGTWADERCAECGVVCETHRLCASCREAGEDQREHDRFEELHDDGEI
jgi:hypothetical protein